MAWTTCAFSCILWRNLLLADLGIELQKYCTYCPFMRFFGLLSSADDHMEKSFAFGMTFLIYVGMDWRVFMERGT